MCHGNTQLLRGRSGVGGVRPAGDGGGSGRTLLPWQHFVTVNDLRRFTPAQLARLVDVLAARPDLTRAESDLLFFARARINLLARTTVPPAVGAVDPALKLLTPVPPEPEVVPGSKFDRLLDHLNRMTDSTDTSTPTMPGKGWEIVLEVAGGLPKKIASTVVKSLTGEPLNSGGDVTPGYPVLPK